MILRHRQNLSAWHIESTLEIVLDLRKEISAHGEPDEEYIDEALVNPLLQGHWRDATQLNAPIR